jgi:uncharacterized protein
MPLMWLPEDPEEGEEALPDDELDVGRGWALGFFEGVALREDGWDKVRKGLTTVDEVLTCTAI